MRKKLPVVRGPGPSFTLSASPDAEISLVQNHLTEMGVDCEFVDAAPLSLADLQRAHDSAFVEAQIPGHLQAALHASGALYRAVHCALQNGVAAALVRGFQHAGHAFNGRGCVVNGLMVAALKLLDEGRVRKLAVIDLDDGYADGTQDIIDRLQLHQEVYHYSLGRPGRNHLPKADHLQDLRGVEKELTSFKPDLILLQAGLDAQDGVSGGALGADEICQRDRFVFAMARSLSAPIVWIPGEDSRPQESPDPMRCLGLHWITFEEACLAFNIFCRSLCDEALRIIAELYRLGDLESVSKVCKTWLARHPDQVEFWRVLGSVEGENGNGREAERCFREALNLEPGDGSTLANLLSAYLNQGLVNRAVQLLDGEIQASAPEAQDVVLVRLEEALNAGLIDRRRIPRELLRRLANR